MPLLCFDTSSLFISSTAISRFSFIKPREDRSFDISFNCNNRVIKTKNVDSMQLTCISQFLKAPLLIFSPLFWILMVTYRPTIIREFLIRRLGYRRFYFNILIFLVVRLFTYILPIFKCIFLYIENLNHVIVVFQNNKGVEIYGI